MKIGEETPGRNISFEHIPATASICSNIPEHTEAVHLVSDGDTQRLVDSVVETLLVQQSRASELCRERYAPYIEALQVCISVIGGAESDVVVVVAGVNKVSAKNEKLIKMRQVRRLLESDNDEDDEMNSSIMRHQMMIVTMMIVTMMIVTMMIVTMMIVMMMIAMGRKVMMIL